jgi:hypothetical protein
MFSQRLPCGQGFLHPRMLKSGLPNHDAEGTASLVRKYRRPWGADIKRAFFGAPATWLLPTRELPRDPASRRNYRHCPIIIPNRFTDNPHGHLAGPCEYPSTRTTTSRLPGTPVSPGVRAPIKGWPGPSRAPSLLRSTSTRFRQ